MLNTPKKIIHFFTRSSELSDQQVIEKILAGERAMFELLMRRYNSRLYRLARGIIQNDDEALDVLQDSWFKIYNNLNQFKGTGGFGAWASKITQNFCYARLRKYKASMGKEAHDVDDDALMSHDEQPLSVQQTPFNDLAKHQLNAVLQHAIEGLPEHYRLVFIMRVIEQLSTNETAESLGITPDTVKQRLLRSKKILRQYFEVQLDATGLSLYEFGGVHCDEIVRKVMERVESYIDAIKQDEGS